MTDPANLLHTQLLAWKVKSNDTCGHIRSLDKGLGWPSQRRAAQLLLDVEELLRRLKEDGKPQLAAEKHLNRWTMMVFGYPSGWSAHGKDNLHGDSLDVLLSLSGTLDMYVPTFEPEGSDNLGTFLDAIEHQLSSDSSYLADHARRVIGHLRKLLIDWETYGEFRIADAMKDLDRILAELAKHRPEEPFWRKASAATWAWFKRDVVIIGLAGSTYLALTTGAEAGMEIVQDHVQSEISGDSPDELEGPSSEG